MFLVLLLLIILSSPFEWKVRSDWWLRTRIFLLSARKLWRGVFDFSQRNPLLALLLSAVSSPFLHAFLGRDIDNFSLGQKRNNRNGGNKHGRTLPKAKNRNRRQAKKRRKKRKRKREIISEFGYNYSSRGCEARSCGSQPPPSFLFFVYFLCVSLLLFAPSSVPVHFPRHHVQAYTRVFHP